MELSSVNVLCVKINLSNLIFFKCRTTSNLYKIVRITNDGEYMLYVQKGLLNLSHNTWSGTYSCVETSDNAGHLNFLVCLSKTSVHLYTWCVIFHLNLTKLNTIPMLRIIPKKCSSNRIDRFLQISIRLAI